MNVAYIHSHSNPVGQSGQPALDMKGEMMQENENPVTADDVKAQVEHDRMSDRIRELEAELDEAKRAGTPYARERDTMNALVVAEAEQRRRAEQAETELAKVRGDLAEQVRRKRVTHEHLERVRAALREVYEASQQYPPPDFPWDEWAARALAALEGKP